MELLLKRPLRKFGVGIKKNWIIAFAIIFLVIKIFAFNFWLNLAVVYDELLAANLGLAIIAFSPALFLKSRRKRVFYLFVISLIFSLLLAGNYLFYNYNQSFLSASSLKYVGHLGSLGSTIVSLLNFQLLLFFADLPVLFLSLFKYKREKAEVSLRKKLGLVCALFICPVISAAYIHHQEVSKGNKIAWLLDQPYDSTVVVQKVGIVNYSLRDLFYFLLRKKSLSKEEIEFVKTWHAVRQTEASNFWGIAKGRNVFLIQMESFQQFLLKKTVNGKQITPSLNKLAEEGLFFDNYYYVTGQATSADAEFSVFNSLFPLGDEAVFFGYPDNDFYALPRLLKENGYSTLALHGDGKNFWNRAKAFPNLGFENYFGVESYQMNRWVNWGLPDEDFFIQSLEKIRKLQQPFLAYLISLTSHIPFNLPQDLKKLDLTGVELNDQQKSYLQSVHYADWALGEFIEGLKKLGLYENSLIVVYGDHESFIFKQEDRYFARFLGWEEGFTPISFLQSRKVPLVILLPGVDLKGQNSVLGSHLDLYPTLANLLGLKVPYKVLGQDLLNAKDSLVSWPKKSSLPEVDMVQDSQHAYISTSEKFEQGKCFEVGSGRQVSVESCRDIYDKALEKIKVSFLVIRGNRLDLLKER